MWKRESNLGRERVKTKDSSIMNFTIPSISLSKEEKKGVEIGFLGKFDGGSIFPKKY